MDTHARPTRRYRTQIPRGRARSAILGAATELFAEYGYVATSIADIAAKAQVARPTVFSAVGNKPAVFQAVLQAAVDGDTPAVPLAEQPWLRETVAEVDARAILRRHAHNTRRVGERISDLYWAAQSAAETDPQVRDVFAAIEAGRRLAGRTVCAALSLRHSLRDGLDEQSAADILDAVVSPATWRALVRDARWDADRWEAWAAESSIALLLDSAP